MGSARDAFFGILGGAWSPNGPFLEYAGVQNDPKIFQKTALKKHDLLIDLSLNFKWILVSFLMFF